MSEMSDSIRKWLLQKPRAELVRVVMADAEVEDISMLGNVRFRSVAETIEALDPVRIEAHAGGKMLRAQKMTPEVKAEVPVRSNADVETPALLHDDPETARLLVFANLLHRAYQFSTEIAFNKLTEVNEQHVRRAEAVEAKLQRTEQDYQDEVEGRIQDAYDAAAKEGESGQNDILNSFMSGMGLKTQQANGAADK